MIHFLILTLFALIVGAVFGIIGKEGRSAQLRYGASIFAKFVGIALVLGWLLYFLPL